MPRSFITHLAAIALLASACQPAGTPEATPSGPAQLRLKSPVPGEAVDASPLLQWEAYPGATHYQVTVADGGAAPLLEEDTPHTLLRVTSALSPGASYYWNVQAQDDTHAILAELNSQFSVKADLVLVWPPDGEAVDAAPVLQWQAFPGADHYQVVIAADQADPAEVIVEQAVSETSYAVSPPLAPGRYRWTAQAQARDGGVLAELASRFSVKDRLEVLDPAEGAEVGASPTLRWAVFPGAAQFQVIVVDADAYPPVVVVDGVSRGTEFVVAPPLKPDTNYSLTIRAQDPDGEVLAEANVTFRVYAAGPFTDCSRVRALPAPECQALVTLYTDTGGSGWAGGSNWLTTDVPCEWSGVICTAGHVTELYLFGQALRGSLPAALADLSNLRILVLRDNELAGPIPPELGRLERLVELDLARNQLSGSLPAELGQMEALELAMLNANQFGGELPAAWGAMAALRHLDLSHNALTGALPAEWGGLRQLESLRLAHNQLSGPLPAALGALEHLTELDVSDNQLSGPVPAPLLSLPYRALWGNALDGTLRCDGAAPAAVDYQGVRFTCPAALGASVWPETLPAIAPNASAPFWEARPEHLRFTLAGAPGAAGHLPLGAALSNQAQVLVFPGQAYRALDRMVRLQFGALLDLLEDRPATVAGDLPLLPIDNAGQALHARVHYLDFANGSGVAYLAQAAMAPSPINNQELFYTFQGVTSDREHYVAAFFPVALPGLPATARVSDEEFASLMANYQAYLAETGAMLEAQDPAAFVPDLAQIDRLIESLSIQGGAP